MNKFDKALECLDEYKLEFTMPGICDDIRLLNSRQNKHIKKAIELGKLYKEFFDKLKLENGFDSYDDGDVSKDYEYLESKSEENCYISSKETVEIYHKIKELESE